MKVLGAVAKFVQLLLIWMILTGWSPAQAHHGMKEVHWYDPECCSFKDCHPVERGAIKFVGDGWLIVDTGQFIPEIENGKRNTRLRVSQDLQNHICRPEASYQFAPGRLASVICLYIAPPGL